MKVRALLLLPTQLMKDAVVVAAERATHVSPPEMQVSFLRSACTALCGATLDLSTEFKSGSEKSAAEQHGMKERQKRNNHCMMTMLIKMLILRMEMKTNLKGRHKDLPRLLLLLLLLLLLYYHYYKNYYYYKYYYYFYYHYNYYYYDLAVVVVADAALVVEVVVVAVVIISLL